jgi:hypothetical protein
LRNRDQIWLEQDSKLSFDLIVDRRRSLGYQAVRWVGEEGDQ